uniref:PDEase domain-containing protein n=1 Tax=Ditylum brightwellii TaxID=49249 RepID=A0A7S2EUC0_9STRA
MNRHHVHSYHNWYHAVSTMHGSFLLLTLAGADEFLNDRDIFAILFGALVHDVEHTGNNNDFEVKNNTSLAQKYSRSVLESHSVSETVSMLENPNLDVLKNVNDEDRGYIMNFMEEIILATDVAHHGETTESLRNLVLSQHDDTDSIKDPFFNKEDLESRLLLGRAITHAADISNPVHAKFEVAKDWCCRVSVEFSLQAMNEKKNGLPVTPYMDGLETGVDIAKMQINFMLFVVNPFFKVLAQVLPRAVCLAENAIVNTDCYREILATHLLTEEKNDKSDS